MKESQRLTEEFLESGRSVKEYNEYMRHYLAAKREEKKYEENVNANLFAVRALAFALLECRSEKEALQVELLKMQEWLQRLIEPRKETEKSKRPYCIVPTTLELMRSQKII